MNKTSLVFTKQSSAKQATVTDDEKYKKCWLSWPPFMAILNFWRDFAQKLKHPEPMVIRVKV
jgi:hypothetical protein